MKIEELFESDEEDIKITHTFVKYFHADIPKGTDGRIREWIKNGKISVPGDCSLKQTNKVSQLPVKFDVVIGRFDCKNNRLTTLEGSPNEVSSMNCTTNKLTSLIGAPERVNNLFSCYKNPLQSLDGLPKHMRRIILPYSPNFQLLKLLLVNELYEIVFEPISDIAFDVLTILLNNLGKGKGGVLKAAAELKRIGYKGNLTI